MSKSEDITVNITVNFDKLLVKRTLLEELLHELTSINGLTAFDKCGDGVHEGAHYQQVDKEDLIELDYGELIEKLTTVLE